MLCSHLTRLPAPLVLQEPKRTDRESGLNAYEGAGGKIHCHQSRSQSKYPDSLFDPPIGVNRRQAPTPVSGVLAGTQGSAAPPYRGKAARHRTRTSRTA
jgi:hypothetical protein